GVGAYEPAGAELLAAEVADHDRGAAVEAALEHDLQHRPAGRAARLAVVREAHDLAELVGPAVVGGVGVVAPGLGDQRLGLLDAAHRAHAGDEARALDHVLVLRGAS